MHEKGRYNIRIGEKRGVIVSNNPFSEENIDSFYDLLKDTAKRDGFAINSRSTFESLVSLQSDTIEVRLFEAMHPLYAHSIASALYIACGDTAYYYYGASAGDSEAKKLMASFVIQ
jgi:lipid II:glycine glycyltransferase (peptidoglycan interpeptide bridge formation enzyme)